MQNGISERRSSLSPSDPLSHPDFLTPHIPLVVAMWVSSTSHTLSSGKKQYRRAGIPPHRAGGSTAIPSTLQEFGTTSEEQGLSPRLLPGALQGYGMLTCSVPAVSMLF